MESKGLSATRYITRYVIKKYNISLYDIPVFELDNNADKINELIKEFNNKLLKKRNQIHLVFYLLMHKHQGISIIQKENFEDFNNISNSNIFFINILSRSRYW